jgi:hypothetical protein
LTIAYNYTERSHTIIWILSSLYNKFWHIIDHHRPLKLYTAGGRRLRDRIAALASQIGGLMTISTTTVPISRDEKKLALLIVGIVVILIGAGLVLIEHRSAPIRGAAAQALAAELAAEGKAFCEKYGMRAGTQAHTTCVADVQAIRDSQAERINCDHQLGF